MMAKITKSDGTDAEVPDEEIWGPPPTKQEITLQRLEQAKAACRARIFAVADEVAQINLAAAAGAGLFSPSELLTYRAGLQWVEAMRQNCGTLAMKHNMEISADESWPDIPAGVAELAERY